jgi:hypothetical protein
LEYPEKPWANPGKPHRYPENKSEITPTGVEESTRLKPKILRCTLTQILPAGREFFYCALEK